MAKKKPASPPATLRTLSEIQSEYNNCAALAGDKQYRVKLLIREIEQLQDRMYELNQEPKAPEAAPTTEAL